MSGADPGFPGRGGAKLHQIEKILRRGGEGESVIFHHKQIESLNVS